jgi:hypothetical protein
MKLILSSFLITTILLLPLFLPLTMLVQASGEVIISEINYQGSVHESKCKLNRVSRSRCAYDKWVELYNSTNETINIGNWSLRFKQSNNSINILNFHSDILLPPKNHFLIGYKEVNFAPTYSMSGVSADAISGKIRNLSNNQEKTVQVDLFNKLNEPIFSVDLDSQTLKKLESSQLPSGKYSLEYNLQNGRWENSSAQYYPNNYGSPQSLNGMVKDFDLPEEQSRTVVSPINQTPKPPPKAEIEQVREPIPSQISKKPESKPTSSPQEQASLEKNKAKNFQPSETAFAQKPTSKTANVRFPSIETRKIPVLAEQTNTNNQQYSKIEYQQKPAEKGFSFRIHTLNFPEINQMYVLALTMLILGFFYLQNLSMNISENFDKCSLSLKYV